jgi:hypothetical protein
MGELSIGLADNVSRDNAKDKLYRYLSFYKIDKCYFAFSGKIAFFVIGASKADGEK